MTILVSNLRQKLVHSKKIIDGTGLMKGRKIVLDVHLNQEATQAAAVKRCGGIVAG